MIKKITFFLLSLFAFNACETVKDNCIPYAPVHVTFRTVADWNLYGLKSEAADSREYLFVASKHKIPSDFPYTALDYTGYGGLLLVADVMGNLNAYDLSCPYEARPEVRVHVPAGKLYAECEQCGSRFDVFTNIGTPIEGPAAQRGYALQRYHVVSGGALEYRVITR